MALHPGPPHDSEDEHINIDEHRPYLSLLAAFD